VQDTPLHPLKMHTNHVFLVTGFLLIISLVKTFLIKPLQILLKSRRLGCGPVPFEPFRWPLGIDVIRRSLRADREQRTPDHVAARFGAMGCYTWGLSLLGTSNLITAEPRNVQALLATQFDDFIMGTARRTNLKKAQYFRRGWRGLASCARGDATDFQPGECFQA
jgi:hypothetical protein